MQLLQLGLITAILGLFIHFVISYFKKYKSFPPGPWGLPIVGYFPWLSAEAHKSFIELGKKYGNIFSVKLGDDTAVVFNDWPSVKEMLLDKGKIFSGRPRFKIYETMTGFKDVAFNDGPVWKKHVHLMRRCISDVGMGKKSMEERVYELNQKLIHHLKAADGQVTNMESVFFKPVLELSWKMIADFRKVEEEEIKVLEQLFRDLYDYLRPDHAFNLFPWLRFFPPNGFGFWKMVKCIDKIHKYNKEIVDAHLKTWQDGNNVDFTDYYLQEIKAKEENGPLEPPYNVEYLQMALFDLLLAGVETTNSTMQWAVLFLALYPEKQEKAQREIDAVVGRDRLPCINDFSHLPYVEALIMEIQRFGSIVPLSVVHKNLQTVEIGGYVIPKNTSCYQNIHAIHHDPQLWGDPSNFRPERFLTEDNKVQTPPYYMPFSIGPRACPGQSMASMELRLIVSCLLHHFNFSLPTGQPQPSMVPIVGLTLVPKPYSLLINTRRN